MIRASVTAGVACALGVMVSACADGGKSPYASLGEDFAKANKAASEIFQAQIADANRVRRLSEVAYYTGMRTAAHRQKIDINAENADDNFANFVCAGVGEGNKTAAALRYTADYAKALEAITKQPGDSFSGYAKALKKLRKDAPVIEPIKLEDDAFDACVRSVVIQVTPLPVASQNESAVAAWQAGAALYDALVAAGKTLLRTAVIIQQRGKLREFVDQNKAEVNEAYDILANPRDLQSFHNTRLRAALIVPKLQFDRMKTFNTTTQKLEILEAAMKTHVALAEYDMLRTLPPPENVAKFFADIKVKLAEATDDRYDIEEIIGFIKFSVGEIENIKSQYENLRDKTEKMHAALNALR